MRTATLLLLAVLATAVPMMPSPAPAQSAAATAGAGDDTAPSYGSYLSAPAQDNTMLRDGLDADEMIGSEVVAADGSRIGAVTDLLVDADGTISHAAVDAGQALGMGSRHVAVDLAQLQRTEDGPSTLRLDMAAQQLADLATFRQVGDRWERIP
jgi:sporulation protein YlmC with PRC-barrel domain